MNYNDSILENKTFSFFKKLIYNIAVAICIMLLLVIVLVYGFKFQLYNVLSDSEYPNFVSGDMIVAVPQKEYEVGDIIKFSYAGETFPVTHRLICIVEDPATGKEYYICHGDAVGSANPANHGQTAPWTSDRDYVASLTFEEIEDGKANNIQMVEKKSIDGKVVASFSNYGTYVTFIKDHTLLLVTIIIAIWCISGVVQNEIDMKKSKRLLA